MKQTRVNPEREELWHNIELCKSLHTKFVEVERQIRVVIETGLLAEQEATRLLVELDRRIRNSTKQSESQ